MLYKHFCAQVVVTPVNDQVAVSTTVLHRPEFITLTETKSDFRLAVRTSVTHVTLTHTAYNIMHVPFTITATETYVTYYNVWLHVLFSVVN